MGDETYEIRFTDEQSEAVAAGVPRGIGEALDDGEVVRPIGARGAPKIFVRSGSLEAMDRRRFLELATAGTAILSGCGRDSESPAGTSSSRVHTSDSDPTATPTPTGPAFEHFVDRTGRHFTIDGDRFYTNGANNQYVYEMPHDWIRELFSDAASLGLTSVRIECSVGHPDVALGQQTGPYEYSGVGLRALDHAIEQAGRHGLRVILVLTDYWSPGGIQAYVDWSETAEARHDFYTDERCQDMFRSFVEHLLTRENTRTGVAYRDDPTIMLWELMNEPQLRSNADGDPLESDLQEREETLQEWIESTAAFVKSIDDNHLVSTGIEGYYDDQRPWMGDSEWYTKLAQDYIENHRPESIDACSMHLYPKSFVHENRCIPEENCIDTIEYHVEDGHRELGKPVYVGEFGYPVDRRADDVDSQLSARNRAFEAWYDALDRVDADGALLWALYPHQRDIEDGGKGTYFVLFAEDGGTDGVISRYSERLAAKSGTDGGRAAR